MFILLTPKVRVLWGERSRKSYVALEMVVGGKRRAATLSGVRASEETGSGDGTT
ncbi:MAG: hypothetical protein HZC26_02420 [Candidatus Magasanikbacteria bacterium]|nr:hypothetical protein [Candidatus Magasanikbacteria bacterium]